MFKSSLLKNTLFVASSFAMQAGTVAYAENNEQRRYELLKKQHPQAKLARDFQPLSEVAGVWEVSYQMKR